MLAALKERMDSYISIRVFSLTLAGLVGFSALTAAIITFTSSSPDPIVSITVPLGGENTVEDLPEPVTAGELNDGDMHGPEPAEQKTETISHPIEDAVAGLHQNTPFGMIPVICEQDGLTAFKA